MFYDEDMGPLNKEEARKQRISEKKKRLIALKKRNKTYLKGRRGVRLYYDYDKMYWPEDPVKKWNTFDSYDEDEEDFYDEIEDDEFANDDKIFGDSIIGDKIEAAKDLDDYNNPNRRIKCKFTKNYRREKLYGYLKYLNGKKVLVRDLAWKFAVTDRTIQSDLRWLENNSFITRVENKTFKGKQTKNSYIVNVDKQKYLPCKNTYLGVVIISKKEDCYYVLTKTNYVDKKYNPKKFIPIKSSKFTIPQIELKNDSKAEHKTMIVLSNIFHEVVSGSYKGEVFTTRFIIVKKYRDDYYELVINKYKAKMIYNLYFLDEYIESPEGYYWLRLDNSARYVSKTIDNKCLKVAKDSIGVK